jgi:hypothetical protein
MLQINYQISHHELIMFLGTNYSDGSSRSARWQYFIIWDAGTLRLLYFCGRAHPLKPGRRTARWDKGLN